MGSNWDNQYDAFQGQSNFYDPSSSQYSYGDPSVQTQHGGNAYPNFMTPADPYATLDQGNNDYYPTFNHVHMTGILLIVSLLATLIHHS